MTRIISVFAVEVANIKRTGRGTRQPLLQAESGSGGNLPQSVDGPSVRGVRLAMRWRTPGPCQKSSHPAAAPGVRRRRGGVSAARSLSIAEKSATGTQTAVGCGSRCEPTALFVKNFPTNRLHRGLCCAQLLAGRLNFRQPCGLLP